MTYSWFVFNAIVTVELFLITKNFLTLILAR